MKVRLLSEKPARFPSFLLIRNSFWMSETEKEQTEPLIRQNGLNGYIRSGRMYLILPENRLKNLWNGYLFLIHRKAILPIKTDSRYML